MRDLTQGSIVKHIFSLSLPTMAGFTMQMLYDLVDIFWIGELKSNSAEALAGVTIFVGIFWLIGSLNDIIGSSSISLISQNYGRKDFKATQISIEQTITFKVFMALIAGFLMAIFLKPLILFYTSDAIVIKAAFDYGYIRLFFLPIMFSSYSVNTILRCMGDAKTPMYLMIFTSILNIVLDPLLMFDVIPHTSIPGLNMGVFGAALATVISQTIAFLIGFAFVFSKRNPVRPSFKGLLKLDLHTDRKLLWIGLPTGIENILRSFSQVFVMKFVAMFGTSVIAAVGVSGRIVGIAFMPLVGISMGASTIIGQNLGAEKIPRARETAIWSGIISTVILTSLTLLCWIFGESIMRIFVSDPEIVKVGYQYMTIGMIGMSVFAYAFGLASVFPGSGYNFPFVISSIISRWAVMLPFLFLAVNVWKLGVIAVMFGFVVSDIAEAFILWGYYAKGKWKTKRVG